MEMHHFLCNGWTEKMLMQSWSVNQNVVIYYGSVSFDCNLVILMPNIDYLWNSVIHYVTFLYLMGWLECLFHSSFVITPEYLFYKAPFFYICHWYIPFINQTQFITWATPFWNSGSISISFIQISAPQNASIENN